jgi:2-keto-4-pentenoate hydratase/2-oxohepta-3-ene-1,7-dioic acid hydratase in catechol pathway
MFRLLNHAGRAALEIDGLAYDLATLSGSAELADPMLAIGRHDELHELAQRVAGQTDTGSLDAGLLGPVDPTQLGPCVPRPVKVFGIGLNYRDHAAESGLEAPPTPLTFTKFPNCLTGPTAEVILSGEAVDWEVEIVAVIGTGGRHIPVERAWEHVAGLTLGQDISDRMVQMSGTPPQFSLGKSFDTYGPIGPALVSVDAFEDPDDIGLWCEVSGERMQDGRSRDLIFTVPQLVAYLSDICTLEVGDLIFTGTPAGVGAARGRFLRPGDVITSGAEVIGTMTNHCRTAAAEGGAR